MAGEKFKINRAPVLTLWAAVVAERLGYERQAALTLGKSVAGLTAQSKGRRLGIFEEKKGEPKPETQRPEKPEFIELLGRGVPAARTPQGLRATEQGKPIDPESVDRYLAQKFGDHLDETRAAMQTLAHTYAPSQLEAEAFRLYEKFRPEIPEGTKGWGAKGELDLDRIRSLARS